MALSLLALAVPVLVGGCQQAENARLNQLLQRQEQLELQLQQLEQRLNRLPTGPGTRGNDRAPAGVVKSLTYRSGTKDDRLRIYWADGSVSDLPCTKEQATLACG
jgi:type II secretory pathway pseudopilin PulG